MTWSKTDGVVFYAVSLPLSTTLSIVGSNPTFVRSTNCYFGSFIVLDMSFIGNPEVDFWK